MLRKVQWDDEACHVHHGGVEKPSLTDLPKMQGRAHIVRPNGFIREKTHKYIDKCIKNCIDTAASRPTSGSEQRKEARKSLQLTYHLFLWRFDRNNKQRAWILITKGWKSSFHGGAFSSQADPTCKVSSANELKIRVCFHFSIFPNSNLGVFHSFLLHLMLNFIQV